MKTTHPTQSTPLPVDAVIFFDGACQPNPGEASYAFTLRREATGELVQECGRIGRATNNQAEFWAVIYALQFALKIGVTRLIVRGDSKLVIDALSGKNRIGAEGLLPLYLLATRLCSMFDSVELEHIPRRLNERADRLCNLALCNAKP
jgi:ribonuclease HI